MCLNKRRAFLFWCIFEAATRGFPPIFGKGIFFWMSYLSGAAKLVGARTPVGGASSSSVTAYRPITAYESLKQRCDTLGVGAAFLECMETKLNEEDREQVARMTKGLVYPDFGAFVSAARLDLGSPVCGGHGTYAEVYVCSTNPVYVWRVNRRPVSVQNLDALRSLQFSAIVAEEREIDGDLYALPLSVALFAGADGPPIDDDEVLSLECRGGQSITVATKHIRAEGTLESFVRGRPETFKALHVYEDSYSAPDECYGWATACSILSQKIIAGLYAMVNANWVHVDLKPANILVTGRCEILLCDLDSMFDLCTALRAHHYNHPMMLPLESVARIKTDEKTVMDHQFVAYQAGELMFYLLGHYLYTVPEARANPRSCLWVYTLGVEETLERHLELSRLNYFSTALRRVCAQYASEDMASSRVKLELIMFGLLVEDEQTRLTLCEARWLLDTLRYTRGDVVPDGAVRVLLRLRPCWEQSPTSDAGRARYNLLVQSFAKWPHDENKWWIHIGYYGGEACLWFEKEQFEHPSSVLADLKVAELPYTIG